MKTHAKKAEVHILCILVFFLLSSFSKSYPQELCSSGLEGKFGTQIFIEVLLLADREGHLSTDQIEAILGSTVPFNPIPEKTVASAAISAQFDLALQEELDWATIQNHVRQLIQNRNILDQNERTAQNKVHNPNILSLNDNIRLFPYHPANLFEIEALGRTFIYIVQNYSIQFFDKYDPTHSYTFKTKEKITGSPVFFQNRGTPYILIPLEGSKGNSKIVIYRFSQYESNPIHTVEIPCAATRSFLLDYDRGQPIIIFQTLDTKEICFLFVDYDLNFLVKCLSHLKWTTISNFSIYEGPNGEKKGLVLSRKGSAYVVELDYKKIRSADSNSSILDVFKSSPPKQIHPAWPDYLYRNYSALNFRSARGSWMINTHLNSLSIFEPSTDTLQFHVVPDGVSFLGTPVFYSWNNQDFIATLATERDQDKSRMRLWVFNLTEKRWEIRSLSLGREGDGTEINPVVYADHWTGSILQRSSIQLIPGENEPPRAVVVTRGGQDNLITYVNVVDLVSFESDNVLKLDKVFKTSTPIFHRRPDTGSLYFLLLGVSRSWTKVPPPPQVYQIDIIR